MSPNNVEKALRIGSIVGSGTPGSVVFIDSVGGLGQDNANFFWDDTNNWLGVGGVPTQRLSVTDPYTNPSTDKYTGVFLAQATITSNNARALYGISGSFQPTISFGVTASGVNAGLFFPAHRQNSTDAGTQSQQYGTLTSIGHATPIDSRAVTSESNGFNVTIYRDAGTITTMYAFRSQIGSSLGGTIATSYAAYLDQISGTTATYGLILPNTSARSGLGVAAPTAVLHLQAGTATAGSAPLKFNTGTNTTVAVVGQVEFDGTRWYGTNSVPTRNTFAWLSDIPAGSPSALTRVDDTNVTITLGGTPTTALLQATSITVGWSGTLAISRGGTGQATALAAFNALSPLATRGDLLTRDATNNVRVAIGANNTWLKSDGTDPSWSALPGSFSGFANPTASIGLTTIDGVLTTAMRSDAAPKLDVAIIPTWTGVHTWTGTANTFLKAGITTTYTNAINVSNTTAGSAGVPIQQSPSQIFLAHGWSTGGAGNDNTVTYRQTVVPVQAGGGLNSTLRWSYDANGGGFTDYMNLDNFGTLNIYAGVVPMTNDQGSLGIAGTAFADLFLAAGGVINWNNGAATITENANNLTFANAVTNTGGTATWPILGNAASTSTSVTFDSTYYGKQFFWSPAGTATATLPANGATAGSWFEVYLLTNQTITISSATADTLITVNDTAADSVAFSTTNLKTGSCVRFISNGTVWIAVNVGSTTMTVAT